MNELETEEPEIETSVPEFFGFVYEAMSEAVEKTDSMRSKAGQFSAIAILLAAPFLPGLISYWTDAAQTISKIVGPYRWHWLVLWLSVVVLWSAYKKNKRLQGRYEREVTKTLDLQDKIQADHKTFLEVGRRAIGRSDVGGDQEARISDV
jgi:hypothetical protein